MESQVYRHEVKDIDGFLSQLVRYVASGHVFYLRVRVPEKKDPGVVSEKLLDRYDIRKKRWQRKRRHLKQTASIHLLQYRDLIVIILSKGEHRAFYADHHSQVRDIRRTALKVLGYSVRYTFSEVDKRQRVFIRLDKETYRKVKAHMLTIGVWSSYRDKERLEREFKRLPYQPFEPVHGQLVSIARQTNRARRRRGYNAIEIDCIRRFRRIGNAFSDSQAA